MLDASLFAHSLSTASKHTCLMRADRAYTKALHFAPAASAAANGAAGAGAGAGGSALLWFDRAVIGLRGVNLWSGTPLSSTRLNVVCILSFDFFSLCRRER